MQNLRFVAVREETAAAKERGPCSKRVKRKSNSNDEEPEQRFFKKSHGELGLFNPPQYSLACYGTLVPRTLVVPMDLVTWHLVKIQVFSRLRPVRTALHRNCELPCILLPDRIARVFTWFLTRARGR